MTWKPASAQKMPGHILIHHSTPDLYSTLGEGSSVSFYRPNIWKFGPVAAVRLRNPTPHLIPAPYRFFNVREKLLYVNGRSEVYEVNISCGWLELAVFDPVMKYCGVPVLFRKLHKLEWLFE
jgi:hypothetical protein